MNDGPSRERVLAIVAAIPDATATPIVEQHLKLEVLERKFGWYMVDHHGDGRIQINAKWPPGYAASLIEEDPALFFFPSYVRQKGLGRHRAGRSRGRLAARRRNPRGIGRLRRDADEAAEKEARGVVLTAAVL